VIKEGHDSHGGGYIKKKKSKRRRKGTTRTWVGRSKTGGSSEGTLGPFRDGGKGQRERSQGPWGTIRGGGTNERETGLRMTAQAVDLGRGQGFDGGGVEKAAESNTDVK